MSYVAGFKNDVFISYSLTNDEEELDDRPWVREFHAKLTAKLRNRLAREGKSVKIYYAGVDLKPGEDIDVCLQEVRQSAVLLAIGSPRYVFDPWPQDELAAFSKQDSAAGRVFIAEFLPLSPPTTYPGALSKTKRIEFWRRTEGGTSIQFSRSESLFENRLADLAHAIAERLDALNGAPPPPPPPSPDGRKEASAGERPAVLLAQVVDSLEDAAYGVRTYLEQYGVRVLPDHSFPQGGPEFSAAFGQCLEQAGLFVQLLGPYRGRRPSDLPAGYTLFQAEQAAARAGLQILQWRDPDLDPASVTDDEYRAVIERASSMGLEQFKQMVLDRATPPKPEPPPPHPSYVFINADQVDSDWAKNVMQRCAANRTFAVMSTHGGSYAEIKKSLSTNLRDSEKVVLIYAKSEPAWLTSQVLLYNKYVAPAKSKPRIRLIYRAFPKTEEELPVFHPDFEVIDAPDGNLGPLFDRLFQ